MSAVVIPSLGAPCLDACLEAVGALRPAPRRVLVVLSGGAAPRTAASPVELIHVDRRLGFAAAANLGLEQVMATHRTVALLNDDAAPSPAWLGRLEQAIEGDHSLAAVQGTVHDPTHDLVDGRGIAVDRWGLPIQVDRGCRAGDEPAAPRPLLAVSGTASLFRSEALHGARLRGDEVFDSRFGSYHEDLDLGLRLRRLGWRTAWVPDALCSHRGSTSGRRLRWRHPWWLLANRWRALGCNLTLAAIIKEAPRLARGELRAVRSLSRDNPRTAVVALAVLAALPWLLLSARSRPSPGARLATLGELL